MGARMKSKAGRKSDPDRERRHIQIRKDLLRRLDQEAARENRPFSRQIEIVIERGLSAEKAVA